MAKVESHGPEAPVPPISWKHVLASALVGIAVGAGGCYVIQNYNPPDPREEVSIVFDRIVQQNELVSVSQSYSIVDKSTDSNQVFGIDVPFTQNSFWYRYVGTLKAGVSLETASFDFDERSGTITVGLSEPYIISNTPNMDESGVLEERGNWLNPIHVEDVDEFQRTCIERSQEEAVAGGLLDEARTNAEDDIRNMYLAALGDEYTVEFAWRDAPSDEEGGETEDAPAEEGGVEDA